MKTTGYLWWIFVLIILVAGGFWLWRSTVQASQVTGSYEASGMMEARTVRLAPEIGGQVMEVLVEEGQPVKRGQPLARLDTSILEAQKAQASAAVRSAKANLDLLQSGATVEEIQAAEGLLAQAEASVQASQAALQTLISGTRPEELAIARMKLVQARDRYYNLSAGLTTEQLEKIRSVLTLTERNLAQVKGHQADLEKDSRNPSFVLEAAEEAMLDAYKAQDFAQKAYDSALDRSRPFYFKIQVARDSQSFADSSLVMAQARRNSLQSNPQTTPEAQSAVDATERHIEEYRDAAQAAYDALSTGLTADTLNAAWLEVQSAEKQLAGLISKTVIPVESTSAPTSVEMLLAQIDATQAARDTAAANLAIVKNGARVEQVQAAQAQVDAAQAQVDFLDVQIKKGTITAPSDGFVLTRSVEVGQTALPGGTLLEVGYLALLDLTIYLPENQLGAAQIGQTVNVTTNAFPDRSFKGTVLRIASEAEFTPGNVQSKEDRSRLVYAVTIQLKNSDGTLKPGMIGDVTIP